MAPTRRARPRAAQRAAQRARSAPRQARSASQILQEPLPPLEKGPHTTTSSAIHDTIFVGKLGVWSGFEASVRQAVDHRQWTNVLVPHVQTSEYVHVGDEHGVQGRFEERVWQVLSHISNHQPPSFVFGDSKCVATTALSKTPDFIVMNGAGNSIIVGEIKTPWVPAHDIRRAVHSWQMGLSDNHLRNMLGNIFGLAVFTRGLALIPF